MKITEVYIWENGNAAVLDEDGFQLTHLQAKPWAECFAKILALCNADTLFFDQRAVYFVSGELGRDHTPLKRQKQ